MNTPVLFLIFNRPEPTLKVFETIRKAKPPRLYIAADGPRYDMKSDMELCDKTREIAQNIDWDCQVNVLFRDINLGCKMAVSGALDWFFLHEESGIILEDDCVTSESWFLFAEEMLKKYRNNDQIMCVSASHFHGKQHRPKEDYFFSIYNHCWGWASWRRAWNLYDVKIEDWNDIKKTPFLKTLGKNSKTFEKFWKSKFQNVFDGLIDTWDYQWTYTCWKNKGITILPSKNLVKNIGFGDDATHTKSASSLIENLSLESLKFPLKHPDLILVDEQADLWTSTNIFGITKINYYKSLLLLVLKKVFLYKK